jgi:hypothetical protein
MSRYYRNVSSWEHRMFELLMNNELQRSRALSNTMSFWFLVWLTFRPWTRNWHFPSKRRLTFICITSQTTEFQFPYFRVLFPTDTRGLKPIYMEVCYWALIFMPLVILHHLLNVFVQLVNKRGFAKKIFQSCWIRYTAVLNTVQTYPGRRIGTFVSN